MGDSKFWLRRWTIFPATRMEAKLFIVFVLLIVIPVGGLTYISSLRYTNTIEKTRLPMQQKFLTKWSASSTTTRRI